MAPGTRYRLPIAYRRNEVGWLMRHVAAGECSQLLGASGSGKSNILQFMASRWDELHRLYSEDPLIKSLIVYFDSQKIQLSDEASADWSVYELIIHNIVRTMGMSEELHDLANRFDSIHKTLYSQMDALLALRYLERLVGVLCDKHDMRLVLLFDEFDRIINIGSNQFLHNLRGLRDSYKYHVIYIVAMRHSLDRLHPYPSTVESFIELFSQNVLGVGPYDDESAHYMLDRLIARRNLTISSDFRHAILSAAGNYPALIRACVWGLDGQWDLISPQEALAHSMTASAVIKECEKIWGSLREDEQAALSSLVQGENPESLNDTVVKILSSKGLWKQNSRGITDSSIFSSLFGNFILKQRDIHEPQVRIDQERSEVWVRGIKVGLKSLAYKLLLALSTNAGKVFSRSKLISILYSSEFTDPHSEITDNRIDQQVSRLRSKIEIDPKNPGIVLTVWGQGYRINPNMVELWPIVSSSTSKPEASSISDK